MRAWRSGRAGRNRADAGPGSGPRSTCTEQVSRTGWRCVLTGHGCAATASKARASRKRNGWPWQQADSKITRVKGASGIMQLVEQHVIERKDPRFPVIDAAAFKSKNLYNAALYEMRQAFIHRGIYLSYEEMDTLMQRHEAYRALPAKVAQRILKQLAEAWKAFRETNASYE